MKRILCDFTVIAIITIIGLYCNGVALFEYTGNSNGEFTFIIISNATSKKYVNAYIAIMENKKFIVYIPNGQKRFNYGDIVKINGKYNKPQSQRNHGGFNYKLYLQTKKICGSFKAINASKIGNVFELIKKKKFQSTKNNIIEKNNDWDKNYSYNNYSNNNYIPYYWYYNLFLNNTKNFIKARLLSNLTYDNANLAIGILIGDITNLSDEIQQNFRKSNLTHMLAVSGDHFSYIILAVGFIVNKLKNKKFSQIIIIIVIILFIGITGATPSVMRAGIMSLLIIFASILHRRPDVWTSMSVSILIQMINNPYIIFDIGTLLSYGGVIGILLFYKIINLKTNRILNNPTNQILIYFIKAVSLTLSANIIIIPIMMYNFNTISFTFVISNILAGSIMSVIVILGFIAIIIKFKPLFFILNILLSLLSKIAEICGKLPLSNLYVATPSIVSILLLYILFIIIYKKYSSKVIKVVLVVSIIFTNIKLPIANKLLVNFIDVGQGDSTLIRTLNETILIDSGGSIDENFDVGKSILVPYLLNRKIKKIDYIIVSHFDADHCQGFIYVMENLDVKNAIIGVQTEKSKLYNDFVNLAKKRKINLIYIKGKSNIKLKDLQFEFLNPLKPYIQDNPTNNNAIVCKLVYGKFSILFTGDIEREAEEKLIQEYKNNELEATILKVGHHGSKTSTTENFLKAVNPEVALIGVGANNKFGHPNDEVIERLMSKKIKIYRTDKNGEISLIINKDGKMNISKIYF